MSVFANLLFPELPPLPLSICMELARVATIVLHSKELITPAARLFLCEAWPDDP